MPYGTLPFAPYITFLFSRGFFPLTHPLFPYVTLPFFPYATEIFVLRLFFVFPSLTPPFSPHVTPPFSPHATPPFSPHLTPHFLLSPEPCTNGWEYDPDEKQRLALPSAPPPTPYNPWDQFGMRDQPVGPRPKKGPMLPDEAENPWDMFGRALTEGAGAAEGRWQATPPRPPLLPYPPYPLPPPSMFWKASSPRLPLTPPLAGGLDPTLRMLVGESAAADAATARRLRRRVKSLSRTKTRADGRPAIQQVLTHTLPILPICHTSHSFPYVALPILPTLTHSFHMPHFPFLPYVTGCFFFQSGEVSLTHILPHMPHFSLCLFFLRHFSFCVSSLTADQTLRSAQPGGQLGGHTQVLFLSLIPILPICHTPLFPICHMHLFLFCSFSHSPVFSHMPHAIFLTEICFFLFCLTRHVPPLCHNPFSPYI